MSNQINDGGPAFPVVFEHEEATAECHGMSLRDYFAAAALQGILSSTQTGHLQIIAKDAYGMADAMLKAREVKP